MHYYYNITKLFEKENTKIVALNILLCDKSRHILLKNQFTHVKNS